MAPKYEPNVLESHDLLKLIELSPDQRLFSASIQYQKLKSREVHPDGKFDNDRRFTVSPQFACCQGIRTPSRNFPLGQMDHGRTALHISHVHNLVGRQKDIVRFARLMNKYAMLATGLLVSQALIAAAAARDALREIA